VVVSDVAERPATDDREAWTAYWTAQGVPWRTEPEVDTARQQYLAQRRAIQPDIERGIYPFRDENGSIQLTRADVEWLLATHESGGLRGPVLWSDAHQRERAGLDLRGANLQGQNLSLLPLTGMVGGVTEPEWYSLPFGQHRWAAINLAHANLRGATLDGARLVGAHLEGASAVAASFCQASMGKLRAEGAGFAEADLRATSLRGAHFERASLVQAQLVDADLRRAFFDVGTNLNGVRLVDKQGVGPRLADVRWSGVNMAMTNWSAVKRLGDEVRPTSGAPEPDVFASDEPASVYDEAVRANRQLATTLRDQGLNEPADQFAYRAQVLQRQVLRRQGKPVRAIGSWLLDLLAGHGYRPGRTLVAYLLAIFSFGTAYYFIGQAVGPHLSPLGALVFSMTSFHGRGFFPGGILLDDPITVLAAFEAFVGLVVEVSFIATFTQRFFAR
jgi:uncharacterized protein YjbI with pentapeptide repeats